jgi:hypothetical protein
VEAEESERQVTRYMSAAQAEVVRRAHERDVEADEPRARAKFRALFGDMDEEGNLPAAPSPKVEHVTRIERNGCRFVFRCSCHAFGEWRRTEAQADADAKRHVAKPWVDPRDWERP